MMKKHTKKSYRTVSLPKSRRRWLQTGFLFILIILCGTSVFAQNKRTIKGQIVDEHQDPIIGATVMVKDNPATGTVTDVAGEFILNIPTGKQTLVFSFIGMEKQEIDVSDKDYVKVIMKSSATQLEDVVVVGYGQQKKESVVGSITQTTGKVLERAGGVTNLGMALTGNLPGVVTISSTGMPGAEDPQIIIRGISSWNGSNPLILVDGIERSMSTLDISSVETVSVLKDASATAVYGVKGANGVILITTKRGKEGKANVQIRANTTAKFASRLPEKYDSYDALRIRNTVIENELSIKPSGWDSYTPMDILTKYRNPANVTEWDRYPNVDWQKELFNDYAMSSNFSANASGGSKIVSYFASVDYVHEGDMFKPVENRRNYKTSFGFDRFNVRSNLDFNLTKTTKLSTNLFGSNGVQTVPWGYSNNDPQFWRAIYRTAPDAMRPIYSDGTFGYFQPRDADQPNSVSNLATKGTEQRTTTQITTDFIINQDLGIVVKGLNLKANLSMDNTFLESRRGINDDYNYVQRKYINPLNGTTTLERPIDTGSQLDFTEQNRWVAQAGSVEPGQVYRKLYYQVQLNYDRKFGKHNVTAMGLFSRDKYARGSEFYHFREDWVFRTTYNYATKYFVEINGAYNGSEKFGPDYRFAFFPSLSGGWMISNEGFMKNLTFIDAIKVRGSWGKIGDDSNPGRFLYGNQWAYGGNTVMGDNIANTPFTFYRITSLGNPNISWESVEKRNIAVEYGFFRGFISGSLDLYKDHRTNILTSGRAVPTYFGQSAPVANLGEVRTNGYEFELRLNHTFGKLRLWLNTFITHAENKIIFADDPQLKPDYQKRAGYAINQATAYINQGYLRTWDDVVGSTIRANGNDFKLTGDYNITDINGDGIIDSYDRTPYQYASNPQNTYTTSFGFEWKGFSAFVQFYGVSNVTRDVPFPDFAVSANVVYKVGDYWTKAADGYPLPRYSSLVGGEAVGTRYQYDGSYLRLKNAEISYTFSGKLISKMKMKSCRIYLNGNNLLLWTKMPDDRESNFSGNPSDGAYPTMRRFNMGVDITL